jgi:hypothetical protein
MVNDFSETLVQAIVTSLSTKPALMNQITGLYTLAPLDVKAPYMIVRADLGRFLPTSTHQFYQYFLTFTLWSNSRTLAESNSIVQTLHQVLDPAAITIPGATLQAIRFQERETDLRRPQREWQTDVIYRTVLEVVG